MSNCFALDSANRCLPQRIGTAGTQPRPFALQSACLFDGGTQCIDNGAAECAFFQNLKAADGGSGRRAHLVLQLAGMLAGFEHEFCSAQYALCRKLVSLRALQAFGHTCVGQGFDEHIYIGRRAAADSACGVELRFFQFNGGAEAGKQAFDSGDVFGGCQAVGAVGGNACQHVRGRVRCGAYDADGRAELLFQPSDGLAGGDGNDGLLGAHRSTDFGDDGLVLVGLYGKEQDVCVFSDGDVVGASVNAEFFGYGSGVFRCGVGAIDFTRRNSAASDNSLDHGFGHISASDESELHECLLTWCSIQKGLSLLDAFGWVLAGCWGLLLEESVPGEIPFALLASTHRFLSPDFIPLRGAVGLRVRRGGCVNGRESAFADAGTDGAVHNAQRAASSA